MKVNTFLLKALLILCLVGKASAADATVDTATTPNIVAAVDAATTPDTKRAVDSWTFLTYIAADNSLTDFALYNINDMAAGLAATAGVNVLVQWDKPEDNKTWRYKITPGGKIDVGTISSEMGYDPTKELTSSMQWVATNFPAQNYGLVLWNHGSGIEDFSPGVARTIATAPWLHLMPTALQQRGILYDDSQGTCLTNQGLTTALGNIKKILGKKLDLIAMDACLMAMVEVTYQMKDLVNVFVASQQTIPGNGFPYSQFIRPLSLNPATTSPLLLAQNMVASYSNYYTNQMPTPDFTLSAIDVTAIDALKQNIDQFLTAVSACSKIDAAKTKRIMLAARKTAISFEMPEYIDLYSFYANVLKQIKKTSPKSQLILEKKNGKTKATSSKEFLAALATLDAVIQNNLTRITQVVLQKASGSIYAGAKGLSIYYPKTGKLDSTYRQTLFAKNTAWTKFIQVYR